MISSENLIVLARSAAALDRQDLWAQILNKIEAKTVLELGVWKGEFAAHLLQHCPTIERYYMLDPWRHLDHWNKPANVDQQMFGAIYDEAMARTDFARERRVILRGTTLEMIDRIPDTALDAAYIDGDHTLRGISIDLIRSYTKIRPGGILGGDDYTPSIWQHAENFEPSLVCPFAAYFAESQGAHLVILPHNQFAIIKPTNMDSRFRVTDTTQSYGERSLLSQVRKRI